MKTKHTNGQWYVLPHSKQLYIAVQDEIIATINSFRITQGESEANAKLIAAAPELLESLNEMVELWERAHGTAALGRPILNKAKEAIKKATE